MPRSPLVSIVTAAYNEERHIGKFLNSIKGLDYPKNKLETIIVDDGSIDNTREIVKKYKVKMVRSSHLGFGDARNLGIKASKGDILILFDADMIVDKNFIKEAILFFEKNRQYDAFEGMEYIRNSNKLIAKMFYLTDYLGYKTMKVLIPRVIKRKIIEKIGYNKPDYGYYIDWEYQQRMLRSGFKIGHSQKAKYYHIAPENMSELKRKMKWGGKSLAFILKNDFFAFARKSLFVFLCGLVPLYILFILLPNPFKFLGYFPLGIFLLFQVKRTIEMFLATKDPLSFLMPFFDILTMFITLLGMVDGLLNIRSKPKA